MAVASLTPWQRVFKKFNVSASELARRLGRHRSKLSRELHHPKGLISGRDQELIRAVALTYCVNLSASDLTGL
jgi:hypothetical protein